MGNSEISDEDRMKLREQRFNELPAERPPVQIQVLNQNDKKSRKVTGREERSMMAAGWPKGMEPPKNPSANNRKDQGKPQNKLHEGYERIEHEWKKADPKPKDPEKDKREIEKKLKKARSLGLEKTLKDFTEGKKKQSESNHELSKSKDNKEKDQKSK